MLKHTIQFQEQSKSGCIHFLLSAILSKGIDRSLANCKNDRLQLDLVGLIGNTLYYELNYNFLKACLPTTSSTKVIDFLKEFLLVPQFLEVTVQMCNCCFRQL